MLKTPKLSKKLPTKPVKTGRLSPSTAAKIRAQVNRIAGEA